MESQNPYQPPTDTTAPAAAAAPHPEGWVPCPGCGGTNLEMPRFTWWGGALGQKLLSHVKCQSCGKAFNAKSGKSNTPAIVVYQVVVTAIVLGVFIALDIF